MIKPHLHFKNYSKKDSSMSTLISMQPSSIPGDVMEMWESKSLNTIPSDPLITGLLNDFSSEAAILQSLKLRQKYRQSKLFNLYTVQDSVIFPRRRCLPYNNNIETRINKLNCKPQRNSPGNPWGNPWKSTSNRSNSISTWSRFSGRCVCMIWNTGERFRRISISISTTVASWKCWTKNVSCHFWTVCHKPILVYFMLTICRTFSWLSE